MVGKYNIPGYVSHEEDLDNTNPDTWTSQQNEPKQ
jgi:hypothetical protein